MTLPQQSHKRKSEIASGKLKTRGTFVIKASELKSNPKAKDALFGKLQMNKDARKKAKAKADKWFSEWIRLRDSGPDGQVKCITCSHTDHWRYLQNGHYVTRGHEATRYDEKNCNTQCRGCNYNGGQHLKHAAAIDSKYGNGTANAIEQKGRTRCSRTTNDYLFIAKTYESRVIWIKEHEPYRYNSQD